MQNDYTFELVWLETGGDEQLAKRVKPDLGLYNESVATKPIAKLGKVVLPDSSDDLILQQDTPKKEEVGRSSLSLTQPKFPQPKQEKPKAVTPTKEGPLKQWMRRQSLDPGEDNPFDVREEPVKAKAPAPAPAAAPPARKEEEAGKKRKFVLREVVGDLFTAPGALAHCVSEDFAMGKGVAQGFRERFGGVAQLKATGTKTGGCAFLKHQVSIPCLFSLLSCLTYRAATSTI